MIGTTIIVKRADGRIDEVVRENRIYTAKEQEAIIENTRKAGRGEVLEIITQKPPTHRRQRQGCPSYTRQEGCPRHGETCAPEYR